MNEWIMPEVQVWTARQSYSTNLRTIATHGCCYCCCSTKWLFFEAPSISDSYDSCSQMAFSCMQLEALNISWATKTIGLKPAHCNNCCIDQPIFLFIHRTVPDHLGRSCGSLMASWAFVLVPLDRSLLSLKSPGVLGSCVQTTHTSA